ncbi:peptide-methionine (R)-S-oxide reductase MsrB [Oleispirillum naphthae]|uniref:peptide-methionine (R)-S-oxide reductase MsrB n=1 Tax=Oleispirillum naphthae TaxID=2838853 RepID=UPI0030824D8D
MPALPPERRRILELCGTEPPFSSPLLEEHRNGTFVCGGCGAPLFSSGAKFESGSGWPSFFDVLEKGAVATRTDADHGMTRIEVTCAKCGGHLGHVFPDGPQPTGLRYCINGLALDFAPEKTG